MTGGAPRRWHADLQGGTSRGVPLPDAPAIRPRLAQAVAYWEGIRPAPDRLPGRRHFDPLDIHRLMPHVWLADVVRTTDATEGGLEDGAQVGAHGETLRFRCRLYGTELCQSFGIDLTGRWLDEPDIGFAGSDAERDFVDIVRTGRPLWWRGAVAMRRNRAVSGVEVVMLPMASDGETVDLLFMCAEVVRGG